MRASCDLILPCRNEAPALSDLLSRVPERFSVIVVDNGSTDDTAKVAREKGARVVTEPCPGYGAAVHAGVVAASADLIAVMDGDGTLDPVDVLPLLEAVEAGRCDLALGRRILTATASVPLPARLGNKLISHWFRRRGLRIYDIAPVRVCRRTDLLALSIDDRRSGYPFELLRKVSQAGWRVEEFPVSYAARAPGTRSKISGSLRGTAYAAIDAVRVLS